MCYYWNRYNVMSHPEFLFQKFQNRSAEGGAFYLSEVGFLGVQGAKPPCRGLGCPPMHLFLTPRRLRRRVKQRKEVLRGDPETPSGDSVPGTPAEVGEIEHVCRIVRPGRGVSPQNSPFSQRPPEAAREGYLNSYNSR